MNVRMTPSFDPYQVHPKLCNNIIKKITRVIPHIFVRIISDIECCII